MKRSTFIKRSSLALSAAFVPTSFWACSEKPKYKMGLQLFSVRDAMERDPLDALNRVAAFGYEDLETYGYDVDKGTYYGYDAREFRIILEDLGLSASSGHYGFSEFLTKPIDELKRYTEQCIVGAKALDKSYITWPWLAPEYRNLEHYKLLAERLNAIGEWVTKAKLGFAYHNHGYEFDDHDGQNGYDIILRDTDPATVKLQMDLYWVMHSSKVTPKEWVAKQKGRFVMWHIKDMDKVTRDYTELGNGSIDYLSILPDPQESGLEFYYIEQGGNFKHNSMQSASDSATYFKRHLQKFL